MALNRPVSGLFALLVPVVIAALIEKTSSQFILEPFDVIGAVGGNVTIYCQVDLSEAEDVEVYWGLPGDQGALGPNRNRNREFSRYVFTGDHERGFYNLRVINVTEDDSGNYTCIYRYRTSDSSPSTVDREAMLTVGTSGMDTNVTCSELQQLVFNDTDKLSNYTCTASGGVPLAAGGDVSWYLFLRDNSFVEIPGIITVDPIDNRVISTIDSNRVILTGEEDNSYLFCSVGPIEAKLPFCKIPGGAGEERFRVKYKPIVRILPSEIEVGMFETFDLSVKCIADSNPPLHDYPRFQFGPNIEVGNATDTGNDSFIENRRFSRTVISITREDIGDTVNCTASNDIGDMTVVVRITSLGGLPTWLICALIFIGGFLIFLVLIFSFICCCKCDLEQEGKRSERRRRTMREDKINANGNVFNDDELGDIDLRTYDQPPVMMPPPDSPHDSGNYADSDSVGSGAAMVNDFKIEEPEEGIRRVSIGSDEGKVMNEAYENYAYENEDQDDLGSDYEEEEPHKKNEEYLQVTIADDTEGEDLQLDELSRDTSPSLNELIE